MSEVIAPNSDAQKALIRNRNIAGERGVYVGSVDPLKSHMLLYSPEQAKPNIGHSGGAPGLSSLIKGDTIFGEESYFSKHWQIHLST
jgi:hypothetical protein